MKEFTSLPRQRGISLVSLLVGSAIALAMATTMMHLFKTVTRVNHEAKQNSRNDSNLSIALISAGIGIQNAGFGIEDAAYGNAIFFLQNSSLNAQKKLSGSVIANIPSSIAGAGNALVWKTKKSFVSPEEQCEAVFLSPANPASNKPEEADYIDIIHLQTNPNDNCTWDLGSLEFDYQQALAKNIPPVQIEITSQKCMPFEITAAAESDNFLKVTVEAVMNKEFFASETYCLNNIKAP